MWHNSGTRVYPHIILTMFRKLATMRDMIVEKWPLRRQLGFAAYFPLFFAIGAAIEFTMINLNVNGVNFYTVYGRKENARLLEEIEVKFW